MIYVLLLQEGKIYVGFSARPNGERFLEHFNHEGSEWTKLYPPLQVLEIHPGGEGEEDEMTLRMMEKYGWWNVRGGSWCRVDMQSCPQALLQRQGLQLPPPLPQNQLPSISNGYKRQRCSRCGRDSHSVRDCFATTTVSGEALYDSESESSFSDPGACYRCGRSTHSARDCYARTDIDGYPL